MHGLEPRFTASKTVVLPLHHTTMWPKKIISVDPGVANFAVVELEGREVVNATNSRVGHKTDSWSTLLDNLQGVLGTRKVLLPDEVVVEDNMFGMKHTVPHNAFIQAATGGYFSPLTRVSFCRPLDKFKPFTTEPKLAVPSELKGKGKTKARSLFIAHQLFENGYVWCNDPAIRQKFLACDHLADALLQAFTVEGLSLLAQPESSSDEDLPASKPLPPPSSSQSAPTL